MERIERLYSGIYGNEFEANIFMGVIYYQRLRHMVADKFQVLIYLQVCTPYSHIICNTSIRNHNHLCDYVYETYFAPLVLFSIAV